MKNLLLCSLIILFSLATLSVEGDRKGNGGGVWICKNAETISSIVSFDLFEAKNLWGMNIISSGKTFDEYIQYAKNKIKLSNFNIPHANSGGLITEKSFDDVMLKLKPISTDAIGLGLVSTEDVSPLLEQEGCAYKQVITYFDESTLFVNKGLFEKLDDLSKAALVTHEVLYGYLRSEDSVSTSIRTRKIVGSIFSDSTFSLQSLLDSQDVATCYSYFKANKFSNYATDPTYKYYFPRKASAEFNVDVRIVKLNAETFRLYFLRLNQRSIPYIEYVDVIRRVFDRANFEYSLGEKPKPEGYSERGGGVESFGSLDGDATRVYKSKTISQFEPIGEQIEISFRRYSIDDNHYLPEGMQFEIYLPSVDKSTLLLCDKDRLYWDTY